ncbi:MULTISPECIES: hypothetical protein [Brenneria]|uniref:Replication-associated protein G2P N-terminal domain-containing protein n=1 Tax=Brenneria nigrifluens DSM 30175 = ATCC 13028 TaxID=1121120 RepID=A0A2U1UNP7_9GAMM|nr:MULTISPECIES: hypothetical protein [Brenneria]EHD19598.1 hypothetical protein BrE312_0138 [Brenneria sp. EniD312]PWC23300.1 hypothetical protein DDT54_15820 [Brenneria nigrifluens DSM 30175 = ATCC 13028]QCR02866.1 hypothetical protein EH206_00700 [Brenneria nigrifluens DSM 30175 = ATCC 13028]
MLLNKYNIDFCSSMRIGKDNDRHSLKIRIDKLTVVSCFLNKTEKNKSYYKLNKMRNKNYKKYRVKHIKNKAGKPYRNALLIMGIKEKSPVLLRIDYSPINHNTGGIRLDFHPQHLTASKIDHLLSWINHRLGEIFYHLLARSWITRIDVAIDIYGCRLDDYIWGLERAGKTAYYDTKNGLPGVRIGSPRSLLHILCYEKVDAHRSKKLTFQEKSRFININLNEHRQFLRIESRYTPKAKPTSKNGNSLMLAHLLSMGNLFERLQIYSNDLAHELLTEGFIRTIPAEPSIVALKRCVMQDMQGSRLPRAVIGIIVKHEIELLNKNTIWEQWSLCVEQLSSIFSIASVFFLHYTKKD